MGIRYKILLILLGISISALAVFSLTSVFTMNRIRNEARLTNIELGADAAASSEEVLEAQAKDNLLALARDKVDLMDEKLSGYEKSGTYVADFISSLYSNPEGFGDYAIPEMSSKNAGVLTPQCTFAENGEAYLRTIGAEYSKIGNIVYAFDPIIRFDDSITTIYFGSESGILMSYDVYSDDAGGEIVVFDPRTREWYINAKEKENSWSKPYEDAAGRGLTVTYSRACYDLAGKFIGVFGMDILLADFTEIIMSTNISENGHAFLADKDGTLIASTMTGSEEQMSHIVSVITNESDGIKEIVYDRDEIFLGRFQLSYSDWNIGLTLPRADVIAPAVKINETILNRTDNAVNSMNAMVMRSVYIFILIFILVITLVVYLSAVFSRKITSPILTLKEGVQEISGGNLEHSISVNTGDEIESLADAFNKMTGDLKEHIRNISRITADKERIATELNVATQIQASMLPCIFPPFPEHESFDIYASMQPAKEVGGDFYDFFLLGEDKVCIVIADVSGKGVPAALFMVIAKTLIKNQTLLGGEPHEILNKVNDQLCEGNSAEMFVTAFLAVFNFKTGELRYVNAGHNPPLIRTGGGEYRRLPVKPGLAMALIEGYNFITQAVSLTPGDSLLLYTDGVTEAMNPEDELYSEKRLLAAMNSLPDKEQDIKEAILALRRDIDRFADGAEQADDITMLLLKYMA